MARRISDVRLTETRLVVQITPAPKKLVPTTLDSVRRTNTRDQQTAVAAAMSRGPGHHRAASLLHDHPPRCTAVAGLGNARLEDLNPFILIESEGARIGVGQRAHEPLEILGGPAPVDQTVLLRTLVEVG